MFGILYLILCVMLGGQLTGELFRPVCDRDGNRVNSVWMYAAASFGVGTLFMGWITYMVSWGCSVVLHTEKPLLWGNIVSMFAAVCAILVLYLGRRGKEAGSCFSLKAYVADRHMLWKEAVLFGIVFLFLTWIMFYVFYIKEDVLYAGFTVFGDYAPHTAMMRSFSKGNNYPTQYPHFGGEDVKYHFMFQFLAGNLEYLGLRMDIAYNLISIFSLGGFLVLLYGLTVRVVGGFFSGALAVFLFFFRSAFTFFMYLWQHLRAGDLLQELSRNTSFIGYTPNEDWGLWNFNVYLNQRHLAFGLLLVAAAVWIYLEWVGAGDAHAERGFLWFAKRLFSGEAWSSRCAWKALFVGLILGLCAFWNGAAVIGGLLILLGFAVFSDGKLDYALTAAVAVLFSVLQACVFIQGGGLGASFFWGFLAEDKSLAGIVGFLLTMSGIFFVGLPVLAFFYDRRQRTIMVSFLFPAVFAFVASLTPDIAVNHKYIMIAYAFLTMFWAGAAVRLWREKQGMQVFAVLLSVCLTVTGIYDFVVILRNNGAGHRVTVNMKSSLTEWLAQNLGHEDLLLTPEYSMNEVTMSGVMLYSGWPYYAWSAGYDTNYRAQEAVCIYTSQDEEVIRETVAREGITYILYEENMEYEQETCREDVIAGIYPLVFESDDGRIRIYET